MFIAVTWLHIAAAVPRTNDVLYRAGGETVQLSLRREGNDLRVDPWPFEGDGIELKIPFKRVRKEPFESVEGVSVRNMRVRKGRCSLMRG